MNKHYLLDTNIISYLSNPDSPYRQIVKDKLISLTKDDLISVSIVTLYELSYGLHSYRNTEEKTNILKTAISFIENYLEVIPLGVNEVDTFGKLKAKYQESTGIKHLANKKNDLDFLIVATAMNSNATLVSNDLIFNKLAEIESNIKYENWFQ